MSFTAIRESKQVARACEACRLRKARFRFRGSVRADRDHTLCFACFKSQRDQRQARALADVPPPSRTFPLGGRLTERQVAHRAAMLAFAHARAQPAAFEPQR